MKKNYIKPLICACSLVFASAVTVSAEPVNESVKVNKVNINDDFALGMDISSIIALEKGGVTYCDEDGNKKDNKGIKLIKTFIKNMHHLYGKIKGKKDE